MTGAIHHGRCRSSSSQPHSDTSRARHHQSSCRADAEPPQLPRPSHGPVRAVADLHPSLDAYWSTPYRHYDAEDLGGPIRISLEDMLRLHCSSASTDESREVVRGCGARLG